MNDETIINMYFSRDENAIRETDAKYGRLCAKIANNILPSFEDSEECVNTSYYKVWNSVPPTKPKSLRAYLCTVVRNTALNLLKKLHRHISEDIYDELSEVISDTDSPETQLDAKQLAALVNAFLADEKSKNRDMFIARYYFNMSSKTIAESFNMSEQAVRSQLHRTREALRKNLIGNGIDILK